MDLELTGKTALVTGSFRGTGMIIADTLLKEGVKTVVHGLKIVTSDRCLIRAPGGASLGPSFPHPYDL